jgi:isoleucyl-tRNA synthetase
VVLASPLIPFTAEEVYQKLPLGDKLETVHAEILNLPGDFSLTSEYDQVERLLEVRAGVFAQFETWKQASGLKDSQDARAVVTASPEEVDLLLGFGRRLANLFKMAEVEAKTGSPSVEFSESTLAKCERCRLRRADVVGVPVEALREAGIDLDSESGLVYLSHRDRLALGLAD